jgi:hypothetical protein
MENNLRLGQLGDNPINEEIYLVLEEMDIETNYDVSKFLNSQGYANLTCCPYYHVDDFTHVEGCKLNRFNNKD